MEKSAQSASEKADLLILTKHATEKDFSWKTQLMVSKTSPFFEEICNENILVKQEFFKNERSDFGMEKVNYPENRLFYVNHAYLTVQKWENIVYVDHFILGQVIPAANVLPDTETYVCGI